jgi:hypothetical protein
MTQELIANTLGVRREGVTDAAGRLHKPELSTTTVAASLCWTATVWKSAQCYAVVRKECEMLLPATIAA